MKFRHVDVGPTTCGSMSVTIGTHSGSFQADEAMGVWMLRKLPEFASGGTEGRQVCRGSSEDGEGRGELGPACNESDYNCALGELEGRASQQHADLADAQQRACGELWRLGVAQALATDGALAVGNGWARARG